MTFCDSSLHQQLVYFITSSKECQQVFSFSFNFFKSIKKKNPLHIEAD